MKALSFALVLPLCLGFSGDAWAQRNLETVIAIQDCELETGAPHGVAIKTGQSLNIYHRAAGRLWVVLNHSEHLHGRNFGWIDARFAIPPDQAVKHFSDALANDPKDCTAFIGRASAELALGQHDKVIADCGQALRMDHQSVSGLFLRARAWIAKEQTEKAIADLSDVLRLDPQRAEVYRLRGDMWQKREDYEKAMADYSRLLRLSPNDCEAYYSRGFCRIHKREYAKGMADFDEVLSRQPDTSYAYAGRGEAWCGLHAYEKAEDDLSDAIRLDQVATVDRCRMAWRYVFYGDFPNALTSFAQLQKSNARRAEVYLMRADCRSCVGDSERALADISQALWINPKSARGLGMRGLYWMDKKRFDLAMADLDAALKLDPKFAVVYHATRGSCLAMQGKNEQAAADMAEALRLGPNDQRACNSAAWFWATCDDAKYRDGKKAVLLGTKACQRSDWGSYASIDTLAAAYAETGDFAEAVRWQKKALEMATPASKKKMADRLALFQAHKPYRTPVETAATAKTAR